LAAGLGASRRTVQDWEAGVKHPSPARLQAIINVLLEAGGLSVGREAEGAEALWAAVEGEAARMRTRFDRAAGCWVSARRPVAVLGMGAAYWCSTTWIRCSSRATTTAGIGKVWAVTVVCSRRWAKLLTRAAWC
jgi:hypothetical protein